MGSDYHLTSISEIQHKKFLTFPMEGSMKTWFELKIWLKFRTTTVKTWFELKIWLKFRTTTTDSNIIINKLLLLPKNLVIKK